MEKLIVVFTERINIGITAIPYLATVDDEKPITLHEHASLKHIRQEPKRFTDDEKLIIETLDRISDRYLFQKYSKDGTLKLFFENLPEDSRFEPHIKKDIEKQIYKTVRLLASSSVPAYYKESVYAGLYTADLLKIESRPAEPVCYFDLNNERFLYSLKIRQYFDGSGNEKEFSIHEREVSMLLNEPAVLRIHNRLYYFENIDSKKFRPFMQKAVITIQPQQVLFYMENFVLNSIRNYRVVATGFEINDAESTPVTVLKFLKNLKEKAVIALHFQYNDRLFFADSKSNIFVSFKADDEKYCFTKIQRNAEFEHRIAKLLESFGLKEAGESLFEAKSGDGQLRNSLAELTEWVNSHREQLEANNITIIPEYETSKLYFGNHTVALDTSNESDWFEVRGSVIIGEFTIPFIRFRKNIIDNDPVFHLPNNELFIIPREWFTRYSELFNYGKIEDKTILLPRTHLAIIESITQKHQPDDKEVQFPATALPDGLNATLRPYQKEGYEWLSFLYENNFGGILADDMGLGKTVQTITLLLKIYQPENAKNSTNGTGIAQLSLFGQPEIKSFNVSGLPASLICMPTSLLFNWQDEIRKFAPSLKIYTYTGGNRLRSKDIGKVFRHYHIVLTSYGVLRNDIDLLSSYRFHYFIIDESQFVKNPSSKIHVAIKRVEASHCLMLTGTPIENSLVDLWTQMDLANHGLLGSQAFFKRHFVTPIVKNNDEAKIEQLQKLIRPFMLRRTKDKVADDLPPVMEQILYCDMTPEQKKFYDREKSGIRNTIYKIFESKVPKESAIIALQALTRLRQIANHPVMVDENYEGSSGKFEQVIENIENIVAEEHNVLVFSSFVKDLELLRTELERRHLNYAMLTGSTHNRKDVINTFSTEKECRIFLISLKAGGVGLNLTKADYVFMLNPWWNPAAEAQAINRAHRIGQTKNVFVYRFLSTGSIEEKIAQLQQSKKQLADTFVAGNNPLKDLSRQEILDLFAE
ncbi:MAG: DEAD/DEAH box helicase [Cytophagaceae bacterium]|jgi:SNF2 family DNA or RNA helicase|nr:DEAD/DEAH box helicase [Cytophagaceae bacterium]